MSSKKLFYRWISAERYEHKGTSAKVYLEPLSYALIRLFGKSKPWGYDRTTLINFAIRSLFTDEEVAEAVEHLRKMNSLANVKDVVTFEIPASLLQGIPNQAVQILRSIGCPVDVPNRQLKSFGELTGKFWTSWAGDKLFFNWRKEDILVDEINDNALRGAGLWRSAR